MRAAEGEDEEISEAAPICHEWLNKISFYIVFHSWEGEASKKYEDMAHAVHLDVD